MTTSPTAPPAVTGSAARATGTAGGSSRVSRQARIAGDVHALRDARRLVAETLDAAVPEQRDAAVLLAGELATNAIVHGDGWFSLEIDVDPDRVRVEVADAVAAPPRLLRPNVDREHGRGLAIVEALAVKWGTDRVGARKVVWFELSGVLPA